MARWPTSVQLNVFAYDDFFYGDTDGDGVIDRIPPNSPGTTSNFAQSPTKHDSDASNLAPNYLNMSAVRSCFSF